MILDNMQAYKVAGARNAVKAVGARDLYFPACSLDLNPIELLFVKLKYLLRTKASRTLPNLWATIREAFTPFDARQLLQNFKRKKHGDNLTVYSV